MLEEHPIKEKAKDFYIPKSETAVLLLHGFTGSPYTLREMGNYLSSKNITILGVRLAGHGSHYNDLEKTDYSHWLHSAREGLKKLCKEYKNVFIVGYSFGGNLALRLANENGKEIKGVALLNVPIKLKRHNLIKTLIPLYKNFNPYWRKKWVPKNNINEYIQQGNYDYIPIKSFEAFLNFIERFSIPDLRIFNLPALIMHSLEDRIVDKKSAKIIYNHIASEDKELHWLNTAEHNPMLVSHRDNVFEKILDFINITLHNELRHSSKV